MTEGTWTGKTVAISLGVGLLLGGAGGGIAAWKIYSPKRIPEVAAPAEKQTDGSVVLEKAPDPKAKPKQLIPKGAKVERIVQVVVQPNAVMPPTTGTSSGGEAGPVAATPCPPVTVDLTLVRLPDQTRRVIASSPDGRVTGGLDIPTEDAVVVKDQKWTAVALIGYDAYQAKQVYGVSFTKSFGPFVAQAGFIGSTAFLGAGLRF
jgi:hypothetical protein